MSRRGLFLDRDGVIVEDTNLLIRAEDLRILPGVADAISRASQEGWIVVMVSNQPAVARGLITEVGVEEINEILMRLLSELGAPIRASRFCPHHPNATLDAYRVDCLCRKPKPGMLLDLAERHDIELSRSVIVGDRLSDIAAGAAVGCRTVLVTTGMHERPPIQSSATDLSVLPSHTAPSLAAAVSWILAAGSAG